MGLFDAGGGGETVFVGQRQRKARSSFLELGPQADAAFAGLLLQCAHPVHIAVAVDFQALAQVLELGNLVFGEDAPDAFLGMHAFGTVDVHAHQFLLQIVVAQAVAVVQLGGLVAGFDFEPLVAHLGDPANGTAGGLGGVEGADVVLASVDKVVGELAVEVLVGIGLERERGAPGGGARQRLVGEFALFDDLVQQLAVVGRDVLHIAHVLVAALDLEAAHAGVDQGAQVVALVVVLHGQHMLFVRNDAAACIRHLIGQTAGLVAVATVGAAACVGVADEALAGIGHAQRTVHKEFDGGAGRVGGGAHGGNLLQVQLARNHDLGQARILQKPRFFGGADIGLGGGVQLDGGQVQLQQAHVLDDQRVGPCVVDLPGHVARALQFIVAQDGVERDEDAAAKTVGMPDEPLQVADVIACRGACAKGRAADVDSICAMVDGFNADIGVAGRGQEFELVGQEGHRARIIPGPCRERAKAGN